jgi:hypothetical protein
MTKNQINFFCRIQTNLTFLSDLVRQQRAVPHEADRDAGHRRHETPGREQQIPFR